MELVLLGAAALLAGFVDAVAGGGGLIQVPALFATFPTEAPAVLFGTNKGASIWGSASAAWRYTRRGDTPWAVALPAAAAAFAASFGGAALVSWLPREVMRPLVLLLLLAVFVYTLFSPGLGRVSGALPSWFRLRALLAGAAIGFYDGFFGPGTGSFLIFAFVRLFHLDFLRASAAAKLVNVATNAAALAYFVPHGQILWRVVAVMALCNVAGALIGSRLALKHGAGFVRGLFLVVVALLIGKLGFDILR
jgi:uncharacterized membrane protein YfcA